VRRPAWGVAVALVLHLLLAPATGMASPRSEQWGLERIRAPEAWATTRGAGIVVAVVDSGVQLDHPDLAPRLLRDATGAVVGLDLVDGGAPEDRNGHGTLVAGIVAAAADAGIDGPGVAGVAPDARILPVRALDDRGRGRVADIDRGIRWAVDQGAHVVNLSLELATPLPGDLAGSGLDDAVRYAWERGAVVVAAAGNSGSPFTDFRSSTPVLLVGATDRDDGRAPFSDGSRRDMVMAPGVDVITTACTAPCGPGSSRYGRATGTSFAAPHVAGAVALLRAAGYDAAGAVARLRATAEPVRRGLLVGTGHGRIDVAAALAGRPAPAPSERETAPTPTPPPPAPATPPSPSPSAPPAPAPATPPPPSPAPPPAAPPAPAAPATTGTPTPAEAVPDPGPRRPPSPDPPTDVPATDEAGHDLTARADDEPAAAASPPQDGPVGDVVVARPRPWRFGWQAGLASGLLLASGGLLPVAARRAADGSPLD
jgi:subtilisin family serine protease